MSEGFSIESRSGPYEVEFTTDLSSRLSDLLSDSDAVVVDKAVRLYHADRLSAALGSRHLVEVEASEQAKSFDQVGEVIQALVSTGFRKQGSVWAIGGGVTQDIAAFVATVIYRGVSWGFVPTTLLAQGDSCIGGKSSINFRGYKNLLGSFLPPRRIMIDVDMLETLAPEQVSSGIGEIMHFLIYAGEAEFTFLEENIESVRQEKTVMRELIRRSLAIKREVVQVDELDVGVRQLFNYGHTFGHAIEAATGYSIPHGVAVSFGVDIANYLSVAIGLADRSFRERVRALACQIWDGYSIREIDRAAFVAALRRDKKNRGADVYAILTSGFGGTVETRIDLEGKEGRLISRYLDEEAA